MPKSPSSTESPGEPSGGGSPPSPRSFLADLKAYVDFNDESSAALRAVVPIVLPHLEAIIDDFYAAIEAHPGARAVITGGEAQIARLKKTLQKWLLELLSGPHDEAYFERRARIGRVHVQISLPQAYMFTAMDRIWVRVAAVLRPALAHDPDAQERTLVALHQVMDIELAIMLETYREDLMAKNRTAERLATIGQFAAGIGHELRNPLGVVETSAYLLRQILQQQGPVDPRVGRHLDKIASEIKRSNNTITELLELARDKPPARRATPIASLFRAAVAAANLPPAVEVIERATADLTGTFDPDQISRVLTNLLINASQAMNGSGRVWLEAERHGSESKIRVRDTGPGVPTEIRKRIFEALFTTKAKGNGLGLALCRQIAEAHGGTVVLEPSETGAAFLLTVPDGTGREQSR
jgi:two-component system, NtrC family, sensor histidine kinase HydH